MDDYNTIDQEAHRLGRKYPQFWSDVDAWDNSGWLQPDEMDAWWRLCREKYYEVLEDIIERYQTLEQVKSKISKTCRYFRQGQCRFGDQCRFSHIKTAICRFYLRGNCRYGSECRFTH